MDHLPFWTFNARNAPRITIARRAKLETPLRLEKVSARLRGPLEKQVFKRAVFAEIAIIPAS